jgi:hypothetical protein
MVKQQGSTVSARPAAATVPKQVRIGAETPWPRTLASALREQMVASADPARGAGRRQGRLVLQATAQHPSREVADCKKWQSKMFPASERSISTASQYKSSRPVSDAGIRPRASDVTAFCPVYRNHREGPGHALSGLQHVLVNSQYVGQFASPLSGILDQVRSELLLQCKVPTAELPRCRFQGLL